MKNTMYVFNSPKLITVTFLLMAQWAFAQQKLSLEDAKQIALAQNQSIKTAQRAEEIAHLQFYKGNAGMLPRVDWNTNIGSSFNNVTQKLSNGTDIKRPNGQSFTPTTNVSASWTLYDGKRMNAAFDRLRSQAELSGLRAKLTQEQILTAVSRAYFEISRQKQTKDILKTIIGYYEEKVRIADQRWQIGKGAKLDFLQSQVDLNVQKAELLKVENALRNAKTSLNGILERNIEEEFEVSDFEGTSINQNLETLKQQALEQNKDFQLGRKNIEIGRIQEKEAESLKKPRITLNSGYGFSLNKSNAGFILLNQNLGFNASIGATWNVFNGEQTRRQIATAKLNTLLLESQQEDIRSQINSTLRRALNQYETDRQLLALEAANQALAEENLKIALEKFKLGASTILELNQAQQSFDNVSNRLVTARYNIKLSELEIQRLTGGL